MSSLATGGFSPQDFQLDFILIPLGVLYKNLIDYCLIKIIIKKRWKFVGITWGTNNYKTQKKHPKTIGIRGNVSPVPPLFFVCWKKTMVTQPRKMAIPIYTNCILKKKIVKSHVEVLRQCT